MRFLRAPGGGLGGPLVVSPAAPPQLILAGAARGELFSARLGSRPAITVPMGSTTAGPRSALAVSPPAHPVATGDIIFLALPGADLAARVEAPGANGTGGFEGSRFFPLDRWLAVGTEPRNVLKGSSSRDGTADGTATSAAGLQKVTIELKRTAGRPAPGDSGTIVLREQSASPQGVLVTSFDNCVASGTDVTVEIDDSLPARTNATLDYWLPEPLIAAIHPALAQNQTPADTWRFADLRDGRIHFPGEQPPSQRVIAHLPAGSDHPTFLVFAERWAAGTSFPGPVTYIVDTGMR